MSPSAVVPPLVTVPYHPDKMPHPMFPVAVDDPSIVQYALGKPSLVGGGVHLNSSHDAYLSVPLQPIFDTVGSVDCEVNSAHPACLFGLLTGGANVSGLTIEGFVRSTSDDGGYVLSTGLGAGTCPYTGSEAVRRCSLATM